MESKLSMSDSLSGKLIKTGSYYLSFIIIGMCVSILGPTLPDLAKNTHSSLSHLSFLFTARSLGFLIGAYLGGRIYDEVKGHPVIAITLLASALFIALIPVLELLGVLIFVLFMLGISESFIDVGSNTLLVWIHREKVGTFMNGLHFFFGVGGFIAPVILAQVIILYSDFSWAYWILALLILPLALAFFIIPSPPIKHVNVEYENGNRNWALVGGTILFFFLWVGTETGFGGWIFTYALMSELTDKAGAAYLTSAFWGAFTISRLVSIFLAVRLKPITMLFASVIGTIISLAIIFLQPSSYTALLIGTIGAGASMAAVFPSTISFSERRMVLTGKITSWFFIGAGIGGMSLPWVAGQYIESNPGFLLILLMASAGMALLVLLWICCWLKPQIIE